MQDAMKWPHLPTGLDGKRSAKSGPGSAWNCPDMRWHPAVRVAVFVILSSLAWGIVALLADLVFGA